MRRPNEPRFDELSPSDQRVLLEANLNGRLTRWHNGRWVPYSTRRRLRKDGHYRLARPTRGIWGKFAHFFSWGSR